MVKVGSMSEAATYCLAASGCAAPPLRPHSSTTSEAAQPPPALATAGGAAQHAAAAGLPAQQHVLRSPQQLFLRSHSSAVVVRSKTCEHRATAALSSGLQPAPPLLPPRFIGAPAMRDVASGGYSESPDFEAAVAAAKQAPPSAFASLNRHSPYSSWRYASARESTDSEGPPWRHSPTSAVTPEVSWRAAGAALAARATAAQAHPQEPPAADGSPGAASDPADGGSRQLWSPSKRAGAAGGGAGVVALHPAVPPGMDAASYAAGERAALMAAFQQALPGQQALGQLFSGGAGGCSHGGTRVRAAGSRHACACQPPRRT